jgi:hypothetical protein
MKRWLAAVLFIIPITAGAYNSTGTNFPLIVVDNGAGSQTDPHVSGDYAAFTNVAANGSNIISFYNFITRSTADVPPDPTASDSLSDVNDGNIVLTRATSDGALRIYQYSIATGGLSEVAPAALPMRKNASIGSSTIAWEDVSSGNNFLVQLFAHTPAGTTQLTNDYALNENSNIAPSGDVVVWEKCTGFPSTCDVYAATLSGTSWNVSAVVATSANDRFPDTNGTEIVYSSDASGSTHIYVTTIGGVPTIIPTSTVAENHPAIAGSFVAFEASDGMQNDLYVYDLATGTMRQITNTTQSETLSDITVDGNTVRVVWQVNEGGDLNIYASEFSIAPPCDCSQVAGFTPLATLTLTRTHGAPNNASLNFNAAPGNGLLCVFNQGAQSGAVDINGTVAVSRNAFAGASVIQRSVALGTSNTLDALIAGPPGTSYTVSVYDGSSCQSQ